MAYQLLQRAYQTFFPIPTRPNAQATPTTLGVFSGVAKRIEMYARNKVITSFNGWYRVHPPEVAEARRNTLIQENNAEQVCAGQGIDALVLKSKSVLRTGNLLVLCINTSYQDHHPRHWAPYLEYGVDVVVWNPTQLAPKAYSRDLQCLLRTLRERNPDRVIAVTSYCMSSDPAILAVSEMRDSNIHLIIDRGHGNAPGLVRSMTILGRVSLILRLVDEECNCHGIEKIQTIAGRKLFILPERIDQIMDYGTRKNFTRDLQNACSNCDEITLSGGDHWSQWDHKTYSQVLTFLSTVGVVHQGPFEVASDRYPPAPPLSWWNEHVTPLKLKCKATLSKF